MTLSLDRPWMTLDLAQPCQVLSWAINRPGFVQASRIIWREVRNADLPPHLDVADWFQRELAVQHATDAVAFLTSRNIEAVRDSTVTVGDVTARCIATVGLSNAEHIGSRVDRAHKDWGTINIAVQINIGLTEAAMIETLAIAAQARTVAVMSAKLDLPTGVATGTGTDCIAIAAPGGDVAYAGMHTDLGAAVGACVYAAVDSGASDWMATVRREADI